MMKDDYNICPDKSWFDEECSSFIKTCEHGQQECLNQEDAIEREVRLHREISIVRKLGYEPYYVIPKMIWCFAKVHGKVAICGPNCMYSLLSFLYGLTKTDPLQFGLDEIFLFGAHQDKEPTFEVYIPAGFSSSVISYLRSVFGADNVCNIPESDMYTVKVSSKREVPLIICEYQARGAGQEQENGNLDIITEIALRLPDTSPISEETIHLIALNKGNGTCDAYREIGQYHSADFPYTRDDCYKYLQARHLDQKEAFTLTDRIRKGRGYEDGTQERLKRCGADPWFMQAVRQIHWLPSRGMCILAAMMKNKIELRWR